jgi:pimeloyl-ACP methyl ester carboxylesterase
MPKVQSNGIEIEYESIGEGEPLLLIMGLGMQLIAWPQPFCAMLADRGYRVIRFDNRDVGLSTILREAGTPDPFAVTAGTAAAPYDLSDMAADTVGLLDALEIDSAHVVGVSLGGMIAQTLAIEHPARLRTLTSIMSSPGDPSLPQAEPESLEALMATPPDDPDAVAEHGIAVFSVFGSPAYEMDREMIGAMARIAYERCFAPDGAHRQFLATLASGNRRGRLGSVAVPTLVIHGDSDPLIPVECGIATAEAVPGARLRTFEGMGHDLPEPLWSEIVAEIDSLAKSAGRR